MSYASTISSIAKSSCPVQHDFYGMSLAILRCPPNKKAAILRYRPCDGRRYPAKHFRSADFTGGRIYFHFHYSSRKAVVDASPVGGPTAFGAAADRYLLTSWSAIGRKRRQKDLKAPRLV